MQPHAIKRPCWSMTGNIFRNGLDTGRGLLSQRCFWYWPYARCCAMETRVLSASRISLLVGRELDEFGTLRHRLSKRRTYAGIRSAFNVDRMSIDWALTKCTLTAR